MEEIISPLPPPSRPHQKVPSSVVKGEKNNTQTSWQTDPLSRLRMHPYYYRCLDTSFVKFLVLPSVGELLTFSSPSMLCCAVLCVSWCVAWYWDVLCGVWCSIVVCWAVCVVLRCVVALCCSIVSSLITKTQYSPLTFLLASCLLSLSPLSADVALPLPLPFPVSLSHLQYYLIYLFSPSLPPFPVHPFSPFPQFTLLTCLSTHSLSPPPILPLFHPSPVHHKHSP